FPKKQPPAITFAPHSLASAAARSPSTQLTASSPIPTNEGRCLRISCVRLFQPISSAGASRMATCRSGSTQRKAAAIDANASGGQNALPGPLNGQSGRGGLTNRNDSFFMLEKNLCACAATSTQATPIAKHSSGQEI